MSEHALPISATHLSDRDAVAGMQEYVDVSREVGATYRVRRSAWLGGGYDDLRRRTSRTAGDVDDGSPTVDIPLIPTLAPAVLTPSIADQLRRIGPLLVAALRRTPSVLADDPPTAALVAGGQRAEAHDAAVVDSHVGEWIRVDYALEHDGTTTRPVLFDVNLMPGMTHASAAIDRVHERCFGRPAMPGGVQRWRAHETAALDRARARAGRERDARDVTFLVRRAHGLVPDVRLAASALASVDATGRVAYAEDGPLDPAIHLTVVRQTRRYSKHSGDDEGAATVTLGALEAAAQAGSCTVLPGFHMGLESHAWPYLWRREPYRSELVQALGTAGYTTLMAAFPRTGVVTDGRVSWHHGQAEPLEESMLAETVVKTSDSTGAEGVLVLSGRNRGRRRYREEALARMTAPGPDGRRVTWVVQDYVDAPRETYPVLDASDRITPVTGSMRYAAYFAAGEYLGGYALLSPTSRIVHGGSGTYWIPVIEPERSDA